jgi:hypothetical protein
MSDTTISDEYLMLARTLADDARYRDAVGAYQRAVAALRHLGDRDGIVIGEFELTLTALEAQELPIAESAYDALQSDLDAFGLALPDTDTFMLPIMFRVARGDTEGVLEAMQDFMESCGESVALADMVAMFQFAAMVHEQDGSPLQASYLLISVAEMYDSAASEHGVESLGAMAAQTYWTHAQFLLRSMAQCVLEAENGYLGCEDGREREAWSAFLAAALDGAGPGDDLLDALRRRVMLSLDASDSWGPAERNLRVFVGASRVQVLIQQGHVAVAIAEARRVVPIAELAGEYQTVAALRLVTEAAGPEQPGPDLGR